MNEKGDYLHQPAGTVTSEGNNTSAAKTSSSASKNGITPRVACAIVTLPIELTTLSTTPTGGVIMPKEQLMMKITPKYTGSMPASKTMGMNTGVKISTIGMKSSTMPLRKITTIIATSSRVWLPPNTSSQPPICSGISATVIM